MNKVLALLLLLAALLPLGAQELTPISGGVLMPSMYYPEKYEAFETPMHIQLGFEETTISAYRFVVTFDSSLIKVDTTQGFYGVTAGEEGFVTSVSQPVPGELIISGVQEPKEMTLGPLTTPFISIHWIAAAEGVSNISITIDSPYPTFAPVDGGQALVKTVPVLLGDVNDDGSVDIVDALKIAHLDPFINYEAADVSGDGMAGIVDALLVARYSAGLIKSFPATEPIDGVTLSVLNVAMENFLGEGYVSFKIESAVAGTFRFWDYLIGETEVGEIIISDKDGNKASMIVPFDELSKYTEKIGQEATFFMYGYYMPISEPFSGIVYNNLLMRPLEDFMALRIYLQL